MGKKRQDKRRRNRQRTKEEIDLVKEKEMERLERWRVEHEPAERADAEVRAILSAKHLAPHAGSNPPPPHLGEPDTLVRAPLKPKPHLRSGAIALPEPEPEEAFLTVNAKSISK
jgi:hypothetical protein